MVREKERVGDTGRPAVFLPDPPLEGSTLKKKTRNNQPSLFFLYSCHTYFSPSKWLRQSSRIRGHCGLKLNLVKEKHCWQLSMVWVVYVVYVMLMCVLYCCNVIHSLWVAIYYGRTFYRGLVHACVYMWMYTHTRTHTHSYMHTHTHLYVKVLNLFHIC